MSTRKHIYAKVSALLPAAVLTGVVFGLDLLGTFSNAVGVLYVAPVVMVGLGTDRQAFRIVAAASICSVLTVVGFALAPAASAAGVAVVNRTLSLLAVWSAASLCVLRFRVEDYAGPARALLPICSSCKKIRDEAGMWNHLESYFSGQFAVKFTHGICPDCVRQLYPEEVKKHLHHSSSLAHRQAAPKPASDFFAG